MVAGKDAPGAPVENYLLPFSMFDRLFAVLHELDYEIIAPRFEDELLVLGPVRSVSELASGYSAEVAPGRYRVKRTGSTGCFAPIPDPTGWKRYVFPPEHEFWRARKDSGAVQFVESPATEPEKRALLGVKSCDLSAMLVLDRVLRAGKHVDSDYCKRRENTLIISVNCLSAAETCFCASTTTGPEAKTGYDLLLTELVNAKRHDFLLAAGSDRGQAVIQKLEPLPAAGKPDLDYAARRLAAASRSQKRIAAPGVVKTELQKNLEARRYQETGERCLHCANCTMVCPTCFCTSVTDYSDLTGGEAARSRVWDSCFNLQYAYIHGGSIRRSGAARYRQWLTHKFATWHDQFEVGGCVGCGRCVVWCPVGIDVREEIDALCGAAEKKGGK